MRAESIAIPTAALDSVLARIILACSTASGGRSPYAVVFKKRVSVSVAPAAGAEAPVLD